MHHSFKLFRFLLVLLGNGAIMMQALSQVTPPIPALFAFGDSILDTGNNNNLATATKCNFPPYGEDFPGRVATGRFSDGRILSDMMAEAMGIKATLPSYLSTNLQISDLSTGVSFASGGSGNDDETSRLQGVIPLPRQLEMFRQYIERLKGQVGEARVNSIISNSFYLLSSGNNDIAITYPLVRGTQYLFPIYANLLVSWASTFLKNLYDLGVRRVGVLSTLPLGCLPGGRSVGGSFRDCAFIINQQAQIFNNKLSSELSSIKSRLPDFALTFVNVYDPLLNLIQKPQESGFVNVNEGCCGTGTFEIGLLCNAFTVTCRDPSTYVFWDSAHPTQKAYELIASTIVQALNISRHTPTI